MLSVDFSRVKSRGEVEQMLSSTIKSPRIRQYLLKNVHRNHDGSFSWKINVRTLHDNLPAIMDGFNPDKLTEKSRITAFPVLFVKGEKSNYIQDQDKWLIRSIFPSSKMVTIPGAGHWLHAEQPELLVKTIKYFLSEG